MTAQKIWIVSIIVIILNCHIDLLLYMRTLAVIAQIHVKQVCCTRGFCFFISYLSYIVQNVHSEIVSKQIMYLTTVGCLTCEQCYLLHQYGWDSAARCENMLFVTDGPVPPNIGGTVTLIFPVSRNSTKEYEKNIYTSYIHSVQHHSARCPILCSTI